MSRWNQTCFRFLVNSAILGVNAPGVLVKFGRFLSAVYSKLVRVLASIKDILLVIFDTKSHMFGRLFVATPVILIT